MRVKYVGSHDAVDVAGLSVKRGESVDVPTEIGKSLLQQETNWQPAAATKTKES